MAVLKDTTIDGTLKVTGAIDFSNSIKTNNLTELNNSEIEINNSSDINTTIKRDLANGVAGIDANRDLTWNDESLTAFTRIGDTSFSFGSIDVTSYYEKGRKLRFNNNIYATVDTATYANAVTTITIKNDIIIPTTITKLERSKISNDSISGGNPVATLEEVNAGTVTDKVITPATLKKAGANGVASLDSNGKVVQALANSPVVVTTNSTLNASDYSDDQLIVQII